MNIHLYPPCINNQNQCVSGGHAVSRRLAGDCQITLCVEVSKSLIENKPCLTVPARTSGSSYKKPLAIFFPLDY